MEVDALSLTAVLSVLLLAVLHTAIGPDHYLPFVMLGRARRWSVRKTLLVTATCGLGHVASSLVLGIVGLGAGAAVGSIESVELRRGPIAAWSLVALGLVYALWGLRQGLRQRRGIELHGHGGHVHLHRGGNRPHQHDAPVEKRARRETTFWALFVVFVLGPCEPLIPLFLLPASQGRWSLSVLMAVVFTAATLVTMLAIVAVGLRGAEKVRLGRLERWSHALAGAVLAASGAAVLLVPI